jgi:hypothetical protein
MKSKTVTSLAFAAGCAVALGTMPSAHAQYSPPMASPPPTHLTGAPPPYPGPPPVAENQLVTNAPEASRGDFGGWSARRNNIESARYDRLLQTNMGFRQARMRKECGPIGDPQLRSQCLASFDQFEPVMTGSSAPPRRMRHHGRAGY